MIYTTLPRKQKIEQHEPPLNTEDDEPMCFRMVSISCSTI